jgi:hypothetical protein
LSRSGWWIWTCVFHVSLKWWSANDMVGRWNHPDHLLLKRTFNTCVNQINRFWCLNPGTRSELWVRHEMCRPSNVDVHELADRLVMLGRSQSFFAG